MTDDAFRPAQAVLQAGRQATVQVQNTGMVTHNLSIPSITADLDLEPGQSRTVIFVAPKAGSVEFFCKLHRDRGMAGSFSVD